jgi:hypothetical protein
VIIRLTSLISAVSPICGGLLASEGGDTVLSVRCVPAALRLAGGEADSGDNQSVAHVSTAEFLVQLTLTHVLNVRIASLGTADCF